MLTRLFGFRGIVGRGAWLFFLFVSCGMSLAQHTSHTIGSDWDEWYLPTADMACKLYVFEIGRGSPVIVVHGGFGSEHSYLLDSIKGLTTEHRFIFYDQRGSLRSPCPIAAVSFKAHIDDLETLRGALGIEKIDIFAHSMGTMITAEYMKDHPGHVGKVVLAGALPMKSGSFLDDHYDLTKWINMRDAGELLTARPEVSVEKAKIMAEAAGPKRNSHLWHLSFAAASIYHVDRWHDVRGGGAFYSDSAGSKAANDMGQTLTNDYDFSQFIVSHPTDVTIISGDHDYADWNNAFFKTFHEQVPFHYFVIRNAGHNMWIDDPDAFRDALRKGLHG